MDDETTTTTTQQPASKVVLYIAVAFLGLAVVLLGVGGPMFYSERQKERNYVGTQCFVQSSSYKTENLCLRQSSKTTNYKKCYRPVWIVRFGENKTQQAEIYGRGDIAIKPVLTDSERFSTGQTYPCWYNNDKPSEVIWYKPSSYVAFVVLICCGVALIIGLILLAIAFLKLRRRPDL